MKRIAAWLLALTLIMTGCLFPASASDVADAVVEAETTVAATSTPTAPPVEKPVTEATATPVPENTATPVPEDTATPVPEDTATPVPENTASPVPEDTATPVPENTATPVPENTATPVPENTATPVPDDTATPAPTEDAAASDLTDLPDFIEGYARLLANARAYETAEGSDYAGVLAKDATVYVVNRVHAGGERDRVQAVVNVAGVLCRYWLTAEKLLPMTETEIDALKQAADVGTPCVDDTPELPLLKAGWTVHAAESTAVPAESPTPTPEADAASTAEASAAPSAEQTPELTRVETPIEKGTMANSPSDYNGKSLWSTWKDGKTTTVYRNTSSSPLSAMPETVHGSYGNNVDQVYFYSRNNAAQLSVTFDYACATENKYDFIYIYNAKGQYVAGYSGTQMAGRCLYVSGNAMYIRFVSDGSYCSYYGMKVSSLDAVKEPELGAVTNDGKGKVQLFWVNHPGCSYQISRATMSASGKMSTFKYIKTVTSGYSCTDTTAEMNRRYVYRVRAFTKLGTTVYYSGYNTMMIYTYKTTTLSGKANSNGTVKLSWKAVGRENTRYEVYRAPTGSSSYTLIANVKELTYTDTLPSHAMYQYRVRPYTTLYGKEYATGYCVAKSYGIPQPPETFNAYGMATRVVKLTWSKVPKAAGYAIYRAPSTSGPFSYVGSTTSATLTDRQATRDAVNYYYICSYLLSGGTRVYGDYSQPISIVPVGAPTGLSCSSKSSTTASISWNPVVGADEYIVYCKYSKSGTMTEIKRTSSTSCYLYGLSESPEYVYISVRGVRRDGLRESCSVMCDSLDIRKNPRTLRALYVIEEDFPGIGDDRWVYDADTALLRSMTSRATPLGLPIALTKTYRSISRSTLMSRINTFAGYADSNDVTLFYLFCHGASSISYGPYAGELYLSSGEYVTFGELAAALKKIPGQVVVILGSCGSGSAIGKGLDENEVDTSGFATAAINAFAAADEPLPTEEDSGVVGVIEKTSELCVNGKFYVIAAAHGGTYSWSNSMYGSFVLQWMNNGVMGADANGDGTVTLDEMGVHLRNKGMNQWFWDSKTRQYYRMIPQIYPTGANYPLFKRR